MGIEPLRLSLRTESKITLGATSLSKWLIAFKWQCFNVHNVLGIFQSFSIAKHHIRKPKKSIWEKIEDRIFHVKVLCKHPFIPFIVVLFEVDKKRWSYGSPSPFKFQFDESMNQTKKGRKRKWKQTSDWKEPVFFIFDFHNFFTLSKRCDKKCPKTFKYVFFFIIFWVFLHNWVFFFKHEIHQFVWHICLR